MRLTFLLPLLVLLCVEQTYAQVCPTPLVGITDPCAPTSDSRVAGHLTSAAINAGVGAVTAVTVQLIRDGTVSKTSLGGVAGGLLSYLGKRVVNEDFYGSGILGRQISSVGASLVANASFGRDVFSRLVLPVGPIRIDIRTDSAFRVSPRVDLPSLAYTLYAVAQPAIHIDWEASFSSGAPVLIDDNPGDWVGRHRVGVVVLKNREISEPNRSRAMNHTLSHERVHILQQDFTAVAWAREAEGWLLNRSQLGSYVHRHAELRLDLLAWSLMNVLVDPTDRFTEREARFLAGPGPVMLAPLSAGY